jgi:hypothetical protein
MKENKMENKKYKYRLETYRKSFLASSKIPNPKILAISSSRKSFTNKNMDNSL